MGHRVIFKAISRLKLHTFGLTVHEKHICVYKHKYMK